MSLDSIPEQDINAKELLRLIWMLNSKIDAVNTQVIQLGIFTEWLADQVEDQIKIDPETFKPFAEKRFKEIQVQAQQFMQNQLSAEADIQETVQDNSVNLNE